MHDDDDEVEKLLADAVAAYRLLPKNLPVGTVIEAMTNCKVLPADVGGADAKLDRQAAICRGTSDRTIKTSQSKQVGLTAWE